MLTDIFRKTQWLSTSQKPEVLDKFISSFHLPPVVGDEKNTKYKTHSEREDSIQGTVNL